MWGGALPPGRQDLDPPRPRPAFPAPGPRSRRSLCANSGSVGLDQDDVGPGSGEDDPVEELGLLQVLVLHPVQGRRQRLPGRHAPRRLQHLVTKKPGEVAPLPPHGAGVARAARPGAQARGRAAGTAWAEGAAPELPRRPAPPPRGRSPRPFLAGRGRTSRLKFQAEGPGGGASSAGRCGRGASTLCWRAGTGPPRSAPAPPGPTAGPSQQCRLTVFLVASGLPRPAAAAASRAAAGRWPPDLGVSGPAERPRP